MEQRIIPCCVLRFMLHSLCALRIVAINSRTHSQLGAQTAIKEEPKTHSQYDHYTARHEWMHSQIRVYNFVVAPRGTWQMHFRSLLTSSTRCLRAWWVHAISSNSAVPQTIHTNSPNIRVCIRRRMLDLSLYISKGTGNAFTHKHTHTIDTYRRTKNHSQRN